ncbi:ATP-dependent helicase/deoxyribonuclease subunit B [Thalictrum thalictroides]|uniref:ATP-dependent helicase/deoxyribonuclease subunit B n=1 Tax=Thalictrum thalictroides TaxID=46969 RepID=A0A7J6VV64_THATH|nr:ATP-dependent helicase/deoxyribonuclease subunit B [Thalictrum thalictroides]
MMPATSDTSADEEKKFESEIMATTRNTATARTLSLLTFCCLCWISMAYKPGDVVPMSKMGQYHSSRTVWLDMIGRQCPIFGVNREVLIRIEKPSGYTGADAYKISFQVGKEKYLIPWLLLINRKSQEVPMVDVHLRYSGNDLHGVTAKVIDMPHHCM